MDFGGYTKQWSPYKPQASYLRNILYILYYLLIVYIFRRTEGEPWPSEQRVHGFNIVNVICGVKKGIQPLYVSMFKRQLYV